MYFYNIGYNSYEECPDVTLCHEKEFTREDLENMVIEAIKEIIPQRKFDYDFKENYGDLLFSSYEGKCVLDVLCDGFGFSRIKYTAQFSAFGWASIFDDDDWESDSKSLVNIRKAVKGLKPNL